MLVKDVSELNKPKYVYFRDEKKRSNNATYFNVSKSFKKF